MKCKVQFKIFFTAALSLLSSLVFAAHNYKADYKEECVPVMCRPEMCLHDGFYLGLGLGYDAYKIRATNTVVIDGFTIASFNPPMSVKGWNASLFAGYGQYYDWFYFAGEAFIGASNAASSYTANVPSAGATATQEIDVRGSYGVAILPGLKVNPSTLMYVRLGYVRTKFKTKDFGGVPTASFSVADNDWENGFNYGLGMETAIYDNWSLRGEYTYTSYSSHNTPLTKYSPTNNQFVLGLIYHFV